MTAFIVHSHSIDDFGNPSSKCASVLASFKTQVEEECLFVFYKGHMPIDCLKLTPVLIKDYLQSQPSFGINTCKSCVS